MSHLSQKPSCLVYLMKRIGRINVVILITALVCVGSVIMTWVLLPPMFGVPFDLRAMFIATLIPAVLCSSVSWYLTKIAYRLHQLDTELRQLANRDSLTNACTRRAYLASSDAMLELMRRSHKAMTVAYIDIDHFKSINDKYGHGAGDKALTLLAQSLKNQLRKSDIIGRIGGDEFAITLPETSAEQARDLLEKICASVAAQPLDTANRQGSGFTISVGIACFTETQDENLEQLIHRADEALREAKKAGRNRVVLTAPATPPAAGC